jgi:formylmethanofuran dehydrogenase subunit E
MGLLHGNVPSAKQLMDNMIKCSRCEEPTPESELLELHAWWVCGICYDEL